MYLISIYLSIYVNIYLSQSIYPTTYINIYRFIGSLYTIETNKPFLFPSFKFNSPEGEIQNTPPPTHTHTHSPLSNLFCNSKNIDSDIED